MIMQHKRNTMQPKGRLLAMHMFPQVYNTDDKPAVIVATLDSDTCIDECDPVRIFLYEYCYICMEEINLHHTINANGGGHSDHTLRILVCLVCHFIFSEMLLQYNNYDDVGFPT